MKIVSTSHFTKQLKTLCKKYPSIQNDVKKMADSLQTNPQQGTLITKDVYKIRLAIASKGKGKSGGARVITFLKTEENQIFLLDIYDKSQQDSVHLSYIDYLIRNVINP